MCFRETNGPPSLGNGFYPRHRTLTRRGRASRAGFFATEMAACSEADCRDALEIPIVPEAMPE
jgi:hypothetical protein